MIDWHETLKARFGVDGASSESSPNAISVHLAAEFLARREAGQDGDDQSLLTAVAADLQDGIGSDHLRDAVGSAAILSRALGIIDAIRSEPDATVELLRVKRSEDDPTVTLNAVATGINRVKETIDLVTEALQDLKPKRPLSRVKQFRMHLADILLSELIDRSPRVEFAIGLVTAVEAGHVGYARIREFANELTMRQPRLLPEAQRALSEADQAFAVGLAMGFMTKFTPEIR